jgi:transcriptional regulator with XRE-family HTH domain
MAGRTKGAILLARQSISQDEIAEKIGVSRVSVSKWLNGHVKPTPKKRDEIAVAYAIPADAWDEETDRPSSPAPAPAASGTMPAADPTKTQSYISTIVALEQMVEELMAKVRSDPKAPPLEQAKVMRACSASLRELADLKRIWDRYERAILRALKPFPDAARALRDELRRADRGDAA